MMDGHEYNYQEKSKELEWFLETLEKNFQVKVGLEDVGVEATMLSVDEVDKSYVPFELFTDVPETFLYEIMVVDDHKTNEWIGAVAFYPNSPEWCLQLILKNRKLEIRKLLPVVK
ncbi:hypothetical protein ACQKDD_16625 [Planococcus kocurii]|uniref:hypothetical protein n=1 Tax=Planococcus kocurii TaxID=1374 RepID=UPI003D05D048